jgi:uncharacterized membrane protein
VINWRIFAMSLTASAVVAWAIGWFSPLPFWANWLLVIGAMVVNSVIAEWEDNRPGGFNNPKGDE